MSVNRGKQYEEFDMTIPMDSPTTYRKKIVIDGSLLYQDTLDRRQGDRNRFDQAAIRVNAWQDEVRTMLTHMDVYTKSASAKALFNGIDNSPEFTQLLLIPWTGDFLRSSFGGSLSSIQRNEPNGKTSTEYPELAFAKGFRMADGSRSLGGGARTLVEYEPRTWSARTVMPNGESRKKCAMAQSQDPHGFEQPDDVLFHELVHALRGMRGVWKDQPVKGRGGRFGRTDLNRIPFDRIEEFYAVLLTNIYVSEQRRGTTAVRLEYDGTFRNFDNLPPDPNAPWVNRELGVRLTDDEAYYQAYAGEIDALFGEMKDVADAFAAVDCAFNPLRSWKGSFSVPKPPGGPTPDWAPLGGNL
jgi:hypothetical protein